MNTSPQDKALKRLSSLVQFEADLREATNVANLGFILVNSLNKIVANDHALFWLARTNRIAAVSGGVSIDKNAAQTRWYAAVAKRLKQTSADDITPKEVFPDDLPKNLRGEFVDYVRGCLVWLPLNTPSNQIQGGLLILRDSVSNEAEIRILGRAGAAAGFVLGYHQKQRRRGLIQLLRIFMRRSVQVAVLAGIIACMFIPVQLSVLAPARSVPANPAIVSAPLDGVLKRVLVTPNQVVKKGEIIAQMETTELQAAFEVAGRRVAVLAADLRRASQKAFFEEDAKAQIGLLIAQLREREAERELAKERLSRVDLRAPIDGVAILADQNAWTGRPVKTGERILVVAEPLEATLEILVPVEDAVVVEEGAEVRFFSSVNPSDPISAVLERVSYTSSVQPDQTLAFRAEARFSDDDTAPRLGFTGTAKIFAEEVPLYYALFRKPAATVRRSLGF